MCPASLAAAYPPSPHGQHHPHQQALGLSGTRLHAATMALGDFGHDCHPQGRNRRAVRWRARSAQTGGAARRVARQGGCFPLPAHAHPQGDARYARVVAQGPGLARLHGRHSLRAGLGYRAANVRAARARLLGGAGNLIRSNALRVLQCAKQARALGVSGLFVA